MILWKIFYSKKSKSDNENIKITTENASVARRIYKDIKTKVNDLVDILIQSKYGSITFYYEQLFNSILNEYKNNKMINDSIFNCSFIIPLLKLLPQLTF